MRLFSMLLCITLPLLGNASAMVPAKVERSASDFSRSYFERGRANAGFLHKMVGKIAQKRLQKITRSLQREYHDNGKGLSLAGIATGVLGSVFLLLGFNAEVISLVVLALILSLAGILLCQIGLDHANAADTPNRWIKAAAYTGLGLNLLLCLVSGGLAFLVLIFGRKG